MRSVQPDDLDDDAWLLLHEVRLRGIIDPEGGDAIVQISEAGLVERVPRGVRLTSDGRVVHAAWARVASGGDLAAVVGRAYKRFLVLNPELLKVCHDWQVRHGGAPNDHSDLDYDHAIFDRLASIDDRVGPLVSSVARVIDRFGSYRGRLRAARQRVDDGDPEWFTSPRIDSYHTVWMQLHEDLLLALGKERAVESGDA